MASSRRSSITSKSKDSLSTLTYRDRQLYPAGIIIDEIPWLSAPVRVRDTIRGMLNFSQTVPSGNSLAEFYESTGSHHVLVPPSSDTTLAEALYLRAERIFTEALEMRNRPENRWTSVISVALDSLLKDNDFHYMQDMIWNATPHPMASATALIAPKPDFAVGFRCSRTSRRRKRARITSNIPNAADADLEPFSEAFVQGLIQRPGIYLKPHVNATYFDVIYPFFCFEAKSPIGTNYAAANQLGGSLPFALGLLHQLRDLADAECEGPLVVFGATSSGRNWEVYVAYEADPIDREMECILSTIWTGNIQDIGKAVEFLWIMERIRNWVHEMLRPRIQTWLIAIASGAV